MNRARAAVGAAGLLSLMLVAACGGTAGHASARPGAVTPSGSAPQAAPLRAGEHFVTVTMPAPYTPQAPTGGTDEYRCFLVDPHLTSTSYLTGSQFLPQNAQIVHHAIFFRLDPAAAAKARAADAADPGEGWTCFGDAGIGGQAAWVASWAPGVKETLLSPGLGYPMPPGSLLVMQVHYNLLATGGKPSGTDQSSVRLRLADATGHMTPLRTMLLSAPVELPCAPAESGPLCDRATAMTDVAKRFGPDVGATEEQLVQECDAGVVHAGPTQSCDHPVRQNGTVYALAGHMHLLGRSISIQLNPGTPGVRTLLDVPTYNFDNQAVQALATPVTVKAGDVLRVTCTHDAGLRAMLPELRTQPPRYVVWGDGTADEMCLGMVVWSPAG